MSTSAIVRTGAARQKQALVLYDGQCQFCQRSVAVLLRLDWLGRLTFQDARDESRLPKTDPPLSSTRLMEEMHLVTPEGHVLHGFGCFRWIAWRLPLLIPLAPVMYLPGIPELGQRIYLWIAKNRYHLTPCSHGACQVQRRDD
jgi:predicted DCC family thiol-disulfide oxidoreductase YuxK